MHLSRKLQKLLIYFASGDADSQPFPSVRYEDVVFLIFPKNAYVMLGKNSTEWRKG